MAVAERGSFMWLLFSITSFLISIKVMNDFEGYATTVFGGTGAAALMLAIILFRRDNILILSTHTCLANLQLSTAQSQEKSRAIDLPLNVLSANIPLTVSQ